MENDPIVQQMKKDLAAQGYVPPSQNNGGGDWHNKIKSKFAETAPKTSFNDALMGKGQMSQDMLNAQGAPLAQNIASHISEAVKHPIETAKGVIKGIPGNTASVTEGFDWLGKKIIGATGVNTSNMGLDFGPVKEMTAPSNTAQETGYFATSLLPAEKAVTGTKLALTEAAPLVSKAISKGADILGSIKKTLTPSFGVRTPEEILATKMNPNEIKKLTEAQREYLFSEKSKGITSAGQADIQVIKKQTETLVAQDTATLARKAEEVTKNITDASNKLNNAGYEEVLSQQPRIREVLRKNGNVYTELIDKQMPPEVREQMVTRNELASQINAKVNSFDPASIAEAQRKMEFINKYLPEGGSNIGDLYDAMKAIRKENVARATTRGTRVSTGDEYQALDTISEISNFLKTKGVDLTEANEMWSKNAEARDRLVKVLSPFTKTQGMESISGLKTLRKNIVDRIQGTIDPEEKAFLTASEDYLGVKFGNDNTMKAFGKLSEAKQQEAALAIEKAAKKTFIKEAEDRGIETVDKTTNQLIDELNKIKVTTAQKVAFRRKLQVALGGVATSFGGAGVYSFFKD